MYDVATIFNEKKSHAHLNNIFKFKTFQTFYGKKKWYCIQAFNVSSIRPKDGWLNVRVQRWTTGT